MLIYQMQIDQFIILKFFKVKALIIGIYNLLQL